MFFQFLFYAVFSSSRMWKNATAAATTVEFVASESAARANRESLFLENLRLRLCEDKIPYLQEQLKLLTGSNQERYFTVDDFAARIKFQKSEKILLKEKLSELKDVYSEFTSDAKAKIKEELYFRAEARRHDMLSGIVQKANDRVKKIKLQIASASKVPATGAIQNLSSRLIEILQNLSQQNISEAAVVSGNTVVNDIIGKVREQKSLVYNSFRESYGLEFQIDQLLSECQKYFDFFDTVLVNLKLYDRSYNEKIDLGNRVLTEKNTEDLEKLPVRMESYARIFDFGVIEETSSSSGVERGRSISFFRIKQSEIPNRVGSISIN